MRSPMDCHSRVSIYAASVLALVLGFPSILWGASPMLFTQLGADENLSQGSILAITQDSKGFIWFGTEDGLNRYDGYDLEHITHSLSLNTGIPNNWVSALTKDDQGRVWVGTSGGGVVWRDPTSGLFHRPVSANGKDLIDAHADVRALRFDQRGRLWIGTRDAGLQVVNLKSGETQEFHHDANNPASPSDNSVFSIREDGNGSLWIGTLTGIDRINPNTGLVTRFGDRLRSLMGPNVERLTVKAVHIDARGTIWIGSSEGLARLDPLSDSLELFRSDLKDNFTLPNNNVSAILEDTDQRLWVGTDKGLALFDRRTDQFTTFRNSPADRASLPDNHIVSLFQDRSGLIWVGTKSGGLARWNPRSWSFGQQRLGTLDADNVTSFAEDHHGSLWVGTMGGGLARLNHAGQVSWYKHDAANSSSISDDNVMALIVDEQDRIWVGTMQSGVERFDPHTNQITRFTHNPNNPASLGAPGVMSMLRDTRGRIWVGTYGGGLARIDPTTDKVLRYSVDSHNSRGLSNDRATALSEDRAGLIWIGTDGGGLNVLDPDSGRFRQFLHSTDNPLSLSSNTVYAIHVDDRGAIWIGTRGGGLDQLIGTAFAADAPHFKNTSEREGLPNSTVYGIESDPSGHLWLSTNHGIARFNPADTTFRNYLHTNGLQGDEFNFGAHYRSQNGELFFGGSQGYNRFYPDQLKFNETAPTTVLTSFLKLNAPVDVGLTHDSLASINLGYRDDVITFRFAALDFTAPTQNHYAYQLEGFDKDWVAAGTARQATYTNLSGGHYIFKVRGSNSDGYWNNAGVAVHLNVEAPPWARWWAFLFYGFAFFAALYAVWAGQQRRVQREIAYAARLGLEVNERTSELAHRNLELEQVNKQLHDASITDPLTGLGNRRYLQQAVNAMLTADIALPNRGKHTKFVLIIIDLDHLKPINDQYGHDAGDRVLKQIADMLKHLCRASDTVVRWGGDEFIMLCDGADLASAALLAERIRSSVAKQIFRLQEGVVARTSCSLGFAPFPFIAEAPDSISWEQSLAFADAALYQAKGARNDWFGIAGTALAAENPKLTDFREVDTEAMQRQGIITVLKRDILSEDTVDNMLARPRRDSLK